MKIKNILVSQPAPAVPEKSPFNEIATKYGVNLKFFPFIKVEGVTLKEYRSQRIEILDHTAVIFTSRTTVDHFFRICSEARITIPETMKYFCNTEAIALYLQKYIVYRKRKIFFANGTFSNLMELILKHKNEKLLLILSEPYKPELPETLEKLSVPYEKLVLSRTVSSDMEQIGLDDYDMVVMYSHPEVSAYTAAFEQAEYLPMVATFGEATARAAIHSGLEVNVMAPTPEAPSMTKALDIFLAEVKAGKAVKAIELPDNGEADEFLKAQEAKPVKKSRVRKPADASLVSPKAAKLAPKSDR